MSALSDWTALSSSSEGRAPSLPGWVESGRGQQFVDLMRGCWRTRAYGDFWSYMLLAEGSVDIATEPELALHDMAALDVIVREAGGRFTNLDGADGPHGPGAIATNGLLHDAVALARFPADAAGRILSPTLVILQNRLGRLPPWSQENRS